LAGCCALAVVPAIPNVASASQPISLLRTSLSSPGPLAGLSEIGY
jgi:hypothetical protein